MWQSSVNTHTHTHIPAHTHFIAALLLPVALYSGFGCCVVLQQHMVTLLLSEFITQSMVAIFLPAPVICSDSYRGLADRGVCVCVLMLIPV